MKASQLVLPEDDLRVLPDPRFVSRGGEKLQAAFDHFPISVNQLVCADIGASTGGFTDCLLQNGASRVLAIDVGYGILDWRLRNDPRVVVIERTNARTLENVPIEVEFITADVSFISIRKILPTASHWYRPGGGDAVVLIKPQFEATREESARGAGVITDPDIHQRILAEVLRFAAANHYHIKGLIQSPLLGPEGNVEFLAWLGFPAEGNGEKNIQNCLKALF